MAVGGVCDRFTVVKISLLLPGQRSNAKREKKLFGGLIVTLLMATKVKNKSGRQLKDKDVPIQTNNVQEDPEELDNEKDLSSSAEEDEDEDEEDDAENNENEVPFSDLESQDGEGDDVDIVPYIKLHKDNHAALTQALSTFALPLSTLPFHVHQSVTTSELVTIDVNDDLTRELAFYKQALEAAKEGRQKLLAEGIPFSRPADYFAEMVKDDEHMERVSLWQWVYALTT